MWLGFGSLLEVEDRVPDFIDLKPEEFQEALLFLLVGFRAAGYREIALQLGFAQANL